MEGNIKVKFQTHGMISIHQGDSTVTIRPLKMHGFIRDLGLAKSRAPQLRTAIGEDSKLKQSYSTEKTAQLLEMLKSSKSKSKLRKTLKTKTKIYHRHDAGYKTNLQNSNTLTEQNSKTQTQRILQKISKNTTKI